MIVHVYEKWYSYNEIRKKVRSNIQPKYKIYQLWQRSNRTQLPVRRYSNCRSNEANNSYISAAFLESDLFIEFLSLWVCLFFLVIIFFLPSNIFFKCLRQKGRFSKSLNSLIFMEMVRFYIFWFVHHSVTFFLLKPFLV